MKVGDFYSDLIYGRADGKAPRLGHRWVVGVPSLEIFDLEAGLNPPPEARFSRHLEYQKDFVLEGREVKFLGETPKPGEGYRVRYRAYEEYSVHMQHVDLGGMKRGADQSELSRFLSYAQIEQGVIAMSAPANIPGYDLKQGDIFIPADGRMQMSQTLDLSTLPLKGRGIRSRHKLVHEVIEAYRLVKMDTEEEEVEIEFDFDKQLWKVPESLGREGKVVVLYNATPEYFVYLDMGEFRAAMGRQFPRLTILSRNPPL